MLELRRTRKLSNNPLFNSNIPVYLDVHQNLYPYIFSVLHVGITRPNYSYTPRNREVKERVTFTANVGLTLRISFKERLSITFTSNGKRKFIPRHQVSPLLVVYCSLFLHIN